MQETENELAYQLRGQEVDAKSDERRIEILNRASSIPEINTIERYSIAGVGGLGALLATAYAVALIEFRRRRLNSPQDLDEGLGITVLGVLPSITARKSLQGSGMSVAQVSEAIDGVRAAVMHNALDSKLQVLMVTCPDALEGGTTVAVNLARSFARAGRRTLLVDGDLRAPALHQLFGLPLEGGFSEVLRSEMDVVDAVKPTAEPGLYLLTAGVCDMTAVHALATDQPQPIFDQLRSQFDYVVIDAAPVLTLADSLSLGKYVDGAILAVLRDHTGVRQIHKSAEMLQMLGIRLLGSVVNGVALKVDRRVARLHRGAASPTRRLPDKSQETRNVKAAKASKKAAARRTAEESDAAPPAAVVPPPVEQLTAEQPPAKPKPEMDFDLGEFDLDLDVDGGEK
jgi:capsular exopolysaccharide synthesis family protein